MNMPRHGVHANLEAEANRLLRESMAGITSQEEKKDILTPWKERDRRDREVYTESGTVDPAIRRGIYNRSWNPGSPHLNSRDGSVRGRRTTSSLRSFTEEHGGVFDSDQGND